tara:strand:+ start:32493 stop:33302 length:810 start_codon:yes stop_codon:yes gene_type:complete
MNVEIMKAFNAEENRYTRIPTPTLCSVFLTPELLKHIEMATSLINENELTEVAIKVENVNWFASLDKRFFQTIFTQLHVKSDRIYFSGAFAPQTHSAFHTTQVLKENIAPLPALKSKSINTALMESPMAKNKVKEIEYLDNELSIAWERSDSLLTLKETIDALPHGSILANSALNDKFASTLLVEHYQLEKHTQIIEQKIQNACLNLCEQILGISIDDHLLTQTEHQNIEILVKSVNYHSGTIYIEGPKLLKNGQIGKRYIAATVRLNT